MAALVGSWIVACGALLVVARSAALDGADELSDARAELDVGQVLDGDATVRLERARADFARARGHVRNPILAPMRLLPVFGRQVRSADALSAAGVDVLDLAIDGVERARAEIGDGLPAGPERIALLRALQAITDEMASELATVDLGPASGLFGTLADARAELGTQLDDVRALVADGQAATSGLADILEGPSSYLVLAANNAEMRSGSGMFLSAGVLSFDDGRFSLGEFQATGDLFLDDGVGMPPELDKLYGWATPDQQWRNLGLSPRFPVTAELATRMWEASGQPPIDGVLAVDVSALSSLLSVIGPVEVDGQVISDENVIPVLLHDQYSVIVIRDDLNDENFERREQLSVVARAVIDRLENADLDIGELAEQLQNAAGGRHLMAWSGLDEQAAVWEAVGMTGDIEATSLLVGVANRGGNKLDQYLDVSAAIAASEGDDDLLDVTLTVEVTNGAPLDDLPYVLGFDPNPDLGTAGYDGFVTVALPAAAREIETSADTVVASGPDGPTTHVGVAIGVPAGESRSVEIRFVVHRDRAVVHIEPSARFPAIAWNVENHEPWQDGTRHRVELHAS